jgi:tetratricopeptide (TPR) repeat protein
MQDTKLIVSSVVILLVIFQINLYAQDPDIVGYLRQIEKGNKELAENDLAALKEKYPGSPSVLFLEGVITEDGREAVSIYTKVLKEFPHSLYADASLYRICAYYYAIGKYDMVKNYFDTLKNEYPQSPYIKLAERNIPDYNLIPVEKNTALIDSGITKKNENIISNSYNYSIQAGAFTVAENANILKSVLDSAGYFTRSEVKLVAGSSFHIIYVGKFVNRNEANGVLKLINKKFNLKGRVVNINSK